MLAPQRAFRALTEPLRGHLASHGSRCSLYLPRPQPHQTLLILWMCFLLAHPILHAPLFTPRCYQVWPSQVPSTWNASFLSVLGSLYLALGQKSALQPSLTPHISIPLP